MQELTLNLDSAYALGSAAELEVRADQQSKGKAKRGMKYACGAKCCQKLRRRTYLVLLRYTMLNMPVATSTFCARFNFCGRT
jgi:hypothetical protein